MSALDLLSFVSTSRSVTVSGAAFARLDPLAVTTAVGLSRAPPTPDPTHCLRVRAVVGDCSGGSRSPGRRRTVLHEISYVLQV